MDYEKEYKDALDRAKDWAEGKALPAEATTEDILKYIFPELAENEDERIRKMLISLVKNWDKGGIVPKYTSDANDIKQTLDWLEKQGTPYTKRDVDDAYVEGMAFAKDELEKQGEQETLCDKCRKEQPSHSCQDITELGRCAVEHEQKSAEWVLPKDFEEAVYKVANFISPFDNEEEFRKTSHRFAEQLFSLAKKELDKPSELSEADSDMICEIIDHCIAIPYIGGTLCLSDERKNELKTFVKSLRNRPRPSDSWEPSEEQMLALKNSAYGVYQNGDGPALRELYEQLKKLIKK